MSRVEPYKTSNIKHFDLQKTAVDDGSVGWRAWLHGGPDLFPETPCSPEHHDGNTPDKHPEVVAPKQKVILCDSTLMCPGS